MAEALEWVDVTDLLTATGARNLTRSGNEYTFSCMSGNHSHGDASPSAGMNARTSLWQCRSPACGLRGNAVDYLAALKGYTRSESMRLLQERYGGPEISTEPGALEAEVERIRAPQEHGNETRIMLNEDEYLDRFGIHWPESDHSPVITGSDALFLPEPMLYMLGRGFSSAMLNKWQIGFDDWSGRITIPIYDAAGILVGIKGRAWQQDAELRYITIGDALGRPPKYGFNTYMKSMHVFGLNRLRMGSSPVLVEGELNAIALDQLGYDAIAVAGAAFSDRQAELIISRCKEITLYLDNDPAGITGTIRVAEALDPYMPVRVIIGAPADAAAMLVSNRSIAGLAASATSWTLAQLDLAC